MSSARSRVGLVPAAGFATRLQPLQSSKEAMRVAGRPLMTFLLERMRLAGCSSIRVTTRPEKTDVVELARREGAEVVLAYPGSVAESLGAGLSGIPDDTLVLIGFPDTVWEPADGFVQVARRVGEGEEVVLGVFEVSDPTQCDVVEMSQSGTVHGVRLRSERPVTNLTWGLLAARHESIRGLGRWSEPGRYLDALAKAGKVRAVRLAGPYIDCGTPAGLARLRADPV